MCAIPVSLVLSYSFFFGRTLFALDVIYGKVVQLPVDHGPVLCGMVMWPWLSFMETLSLSWYSIKPRRQEKWKWKQSGEKKWNSSSNSWTQRKGKGIRHWKEAESKNSNSLQKLDDLPWSSEWAGLTLLLLNNDCLGSRDSLMLVLLSILMLSLVLVISIYLFCVFSQ